jgi:plastocyanin
MLLRARKLRLLCFHQICPQIRLTTHALEASMQRTMLLTVLFATFVAVGCSSSGSSNDDASGSAGASGSGGGGSGGGGSGAVFVSINPCTAASVYVTGMTTIQATDTFEYSPACLKVTAGTKVTIQASDTHPLSGLATGSANNPIPTGGKTVDQMVTFTAPGFYPFHCDVHAAIGMKGVVWVE